MPKHKLNELLLFENIFPIKFLKTIRQHDSIMVVVDKLSKDAHFIIAKSNHKASNILEIYMKEIAILHGIPKTIVFDRDSIFTSNYEKGLFKEFGTKLNFNTTYHLQTNG